MKPNILYYSFCIEMATKVVHDYFVNIRKAYNSTIRGFASNDIIAIILTNIPYLYSFGICVYNILHPTFFQSMIWLFFAILTITEILTIISVRKTMPNLLTFSIFIYTAFGHWCIITNILMIFYVSAYYGIVSFMFATLCPSAILLLFCGDILRAMRRRMYDKIAELPQPT